MTQEEIIAELVKRYDAPNRPNLPVDVSKEKRTIYVEVDNKWLGVSRTALEDAIGDERADAIWNWAHH